MDKTKVIVMGTGNATKQFIVSNETNEYIEIIGIVLDAAVPMEDRKIFMLDLNASLNYPIEEFELSRDNFAKADLIFTPEYRRIIPQELTDSFCIVNCHGGILPRWRGFSANAWAIMNGENEVGFSIHRVRPGMDDGEIYYVKRIPINKYQTYADVHGEMLNGIATDVPKVLYDVANGLNHGKAQPKDGFAYCNRFTRSMGDISSFDEESEYYVNLFRCMARPLGTGLTFLYKGSTYEVNKVQHGRDFGIIDYVGITGKVVNICDDALWVKTRDNVIVLADLYVNGSRVDISDCFKNGNKLGS